MHLIIEFQFAQEVDKSTIIIRFQHLLSVDDRLSR